MKRIRQAAAAVAIAGLGAGSFWAASSLVGDVQFARAEQQVDASRQQLAEVRDLSDVFKSVNRAVEPSVVSIQVVKKVQGPQFGGGGFMTPPGMGEVPDQLKPFFRQSPGDDAPDQDDSGDSDAPGDAPQGGFTQVGQGSGVIMDFKDGVGYVLTNNHVAEDADQIAVALSDGRTIRDVKVLGTDPKSDLAVLEVRADKLIPAEWGDSGTLEKGDLILAFGSPLGFVGSMTHGIVSALDRQVGIIGGDFAYEDFIQVDAPINPGNSGGPLVNLKGEVVGINTAIASRTRQFSGIGFAIPSNQAHRVYDDLKSEGRVTRGWLGVAIADVKDERVKSAAEAAGFDGDQGVFVSQTFRNTPASGVLQPGDVITALDGKKVEDSRALRSLIAATAPGTKVSMTVTRAGDSQKVSVTLGEQPDERGQVVADRAAKGDADRTGDVGLSLVDPTDRQLKRADADGGAVVAQVAPDSPAARAGLKRGDVITRVGKTDVSDAADAVAALKGADLSQGVALRVSGPDGQRFVLVKSSQE